MVLFHLTKGKRDTCFKISKVCLFKVTVHSNNRNSKSSREVILGSVRLWQSVILRNYDIFSTDSNAVTLHVGNLKVTNITFKCKQNFKYDEQQKYACKRWTLSSV